MLNDLIKIYKIIDEHIIIRKSLDFDSTRFFVAINHLMKRSDPAEFFANKNLGRNQFVRIVDRICSSLGIVRDGASKTVTTHGLRTNIIFLLVQLEYNDSAIELRSGHRNLKSLKRYHNLKDAVGIYQISRMLESTSSEICESKVKIGSEAARTGRVLCYAENIDAEETHREFKLEE